jgi:serine/threonine-protein kinase
MGDFEFIVTDGAGRSQSYAFPAQRFTIGSAEDAHLRFDARQVQPKHAEVMFDNGGNPWIRDLTRRNLLQVNGETTDQAAIPNGAFIQLGTLELTVRERSVAAGPSGTMAVPTPIKSQQPARTSGTNRAPSSARNPEVRQSSARQTGVKQTGARPGVVSLGGDAPPDEVIDATARRPTPFGPAGAVSAALAEGQSTGEEETVNSLSILATGTVIHDKYRVLGKLAAGGMGEVYRAEHVTLGKPLALKVMRHELSRDKEFVDRFKSEAIAASGIGQQNIVDISDYGQTHDGRFFFVMEFLDGMTLSSAIHRGGPMHVERAVSVIVQVARALAAAHDKGIVHRDMKPENVMLLQRPGQPDFVKVVDFGVAKVSQGKGQGGHTAIGMVVGTPQYMSPEQAKAIPVDARSDIYSVGLILYELISGRPTFTGETPSILMVKHVTEAPPPLVDGALDSVPEELEQLVYQMLEKDPAGRPQTMEEVVATLDSLHARLKSGDPTLRPAAPASKATPAAPASGVAVRVSGGYRSVVSSGSHRGMQEQLPAPDDEPIAPPASSKLPMVLGGLVVLALLAGGAFFALKPDPKPPVVEVVKPVDPVTPPVVDKPVEPVKPVEPAKAEPVKVTIDTEPTGADVYEGDVMVGTTPVTLSRGVNSAAIEFTFSLTGYKPLKRKIGFSAELTQGIKVKLEKERPGVVTPRNGNGKPPDLHDLQELPDDKKPVEPPPLKDL